MRRVGLFLCLFLAGCGYTVQRVPAPSVKVTTAAGAVIEQKGTAEVPSKVTTTAQGSQVQLPAGTKLTFDEKLGTWDLSLPQATVLHIDSHSETVEGPTAFKPAAPPTPSDIADGRALLWYRIALGVGLAAAVFGLVRNWDLVMTGGCCVAGGAALGIWVHTHPFLTYALIGCGLALKFAGPYVWHTYLKPPDLKTT